MALNKGTSLEAKLHKKIQLNGNTITQIRPITKNADGTVTNAIRTSIKCLDASSLGERMFIAYMAQMGLTNAGNFERDTLIFAGREDIQETDEFEYQGYHRGSTRAKALPISDVIVLWEVNAVRQRKL